MIASTPRMTTEQMLALPGGGVERWLIGGRLYQRPAEPHGERHARAVANFAYELLVWSGSRPGPRGEVLANFPAIRLRREPDTTLDIDVAYFPHAVAGDAAVIDGVPTLAVEIPAPRDTYGDIWDRADAFLDAGVSVVWEVSTYWRSVIAYGQGDYPVLFTAKQELTAEPHLPGFRVPVARLFA